MYARKPSSLDLIRSPVCAQPVRFERSLARPGKVRSDERGVRHDERDGEDGGGLHSQDGLGDGSVEELERC